MEFFKQNYFKTENIFKKIFENRKYFKAKNI
jgi:hypothetical protein